MSKVPVDWFRYIRMIGICWDAEVVKGCQYTLMWLERLGWHRQHIGGVSLAGALVRLIHYVGGWGHRMWLLLGGRRSCRGGSWTTLPKISLADHTGLRDGWKTPELEEDFWRIHDRLGWV